MSYQNNNPMNIMMNGINNPMNNQGNPNNQMNPFYNSNNSVNNNQIQNQSSINNFPPNEQYAYSMNNMKSDSFSLLNKIVNSILIEAHNHPLYSCYVLVIIVEIIMNSKFLLFIALIVNLIYAKIV